jgi:hypothetical protein
VLGLVHDGRFALGIGEDPVVSSGDHLLIAQPCPPRPTAAERVERRSPAPA